MHETRLYYPGFEVKPLSDPLGFEYGPDVFFSEPENRHLDDIRRSLRDPACGGPSVVYSISMDIGKKKHIQIMQTTHLLYGAVVYASGKLGREPIRSQGHIHKVSKLSGLSTPEVYEIWQGEAIIYMQEFAGNYPGKCFAVHARPGDVVIIPPGWVHATINSKPLKPMSFGAWCDRDYGFVYDDVRKRKGIAWFPLFNDNDQIIWERNPNYAVSELQEKTPKDYSKFGIIKGIPIYSTFEKDPKVFAFVSHPEIMKDEWEHFIP